MAARDQYGISLAQFIDFQLIVEVPIRLDDGPSIVSFAVPIIIPHSNKANRISSPRTGVVYIRVEDFPSYHYRHRVIRIHSKNH